MAAGAYPDVRSRGRRDGSRDARRLHARRRRPPTPTTRLYAEYKQLHDHFGRGGSDVMKRLKAIRREAALAEREGVIA